MNVYYFGGVLLGLVSTTLFSIATILQKEALGKVEQLEVSNFISQLKRLIKNKTWLLSIAIGVIGGFPYTIALEWIGAAVLQPLMSFGFITLVIFARRRFNEKLDMRAKISIFLMMLMPIFITFSNVHNVVHDITLWIYQRNLLLFGGFLFIISIVLWVYAKKIPYLYAFCCGILYSLGAIFSQAGISYLTFSGYAIEENLGEIIEDAFSDIRLLPMVLFVIISAVFNMLAGGVQQFGLQKNDASKFGPTNQTLNILLTISAGIVIFGQTIGSWTFYTLAVLFGIIGTVGLGSFESIKVQPIEAVEFNVSVGDIEEDK